MADGDQRGAMKKGLKQSDGNATAFMQFSALSCAFYQPRIAG